MSRQVRDRAVSFVHPDGDAVLISLLADCVRPNSALLISDGPEEVYPSSCMKTKMCCDTLKRFESLLASLMGIDPTGAFFKQSHVAAAIKTGLSKTDMIALNASGMTKYNLPPQETVDLLAYKLRVMASHCRLLHDSVQSPHDHQLSFIFRAMHGTTSSNGGDMRKVRRESRLCKRANPFMFFRTDDQGSGEEDDDEPVQAVVRTFDGATARALMSDGSRVNADSYEAGADGFIKAKWFSLGCELALGLPNSRLNPINEIIPIEVAGASSGALPGESDPAAIDDEEIESDEPFDDEARNKHTHTHTPHMF